MKLKRTVSCLVLFTACMFGQRTSQPSHAPAKASAQTNDSTAKNGTSKTPDAKQAKADPVVPYLLLQQLNAERKAKASETRQGQPLPVVEVYTREFTCVGYGVVDIYLPSTEALLNSKQMPQDVLALACKYGFKPIGLAALSSQYGIVIVSESPTATRYLYGAPVDRLYHIRPGQVFVPRSEDRFIGTLLPIAK